MHTAALESDSQEQPPIPPNRAAHVAQRVRGGAPEAPVAALDRRQRVYLAAAGCQVAVLRELAPQEADKGGDGLWGVRGVVVVRCDGVRCDV